jgi:hypothetical protein
LPEVSKKVPKRGHLHMTKQPNADASSKREAEMPTLGNQTDNKTTVYAGYIGRAFSSTKCKNVEQKIDTLMVTQQDSKLTYLIGSTQS